MMGLSGKQMFQAFGIMLLIAGGAMFTGFWTPIAGATLIYDPTNPVITTINNPSGTSSNPTPWTSGGGTCMSITCSDPETGIASVTYKIYQDSSSTVLASGTCINYGSGIYISSTYTVPTGEHNYKVSFTVTNGAGFTSTADGYATTNAPTGYFSVNGQQVTETSTIAVQNANLTLKFTATAYGNLIDSVIVNLRQNGTIVKTATLAETTADSVWTGSLVIPSAGSYTIDGTITQGTSGYRLMSIAFSYGVDPTPISLSWDQIIGILLMAFGGVVGIRGKIL